jgi:hypothetical protein
MDAHSQSFFQYDYGYPFYRSSHHHVWMLSIVVVYCLCGDDQYSTCFIIRGSTTLQLLTVVLYDCSTILYYTILYCSTILYVYTVYTIHSVRKT